MTFDNRAHSINYKRWHKCDRCRVFSLFDDNPEKTMNICPDCWKLWKDLPQYRVTKKFKKPPKQFETDDWPIEHMLLYLLFCSSTLLIISYYLWIH